MADKSDVIEEIFNVCHPNEEDRSEIKYEVPFLINFQDESPMDMLKKKKDFKGMDMLLQYLSGYGIDHHSRAIVEILPVLIEHDLPTFPDYLKSRLLQTEKVKLFKKGMLRVKENPGIAVASFWQSQEDIDSLLQPAPIEQELRLEFVDIPKIHTYTEPIANEFMSVLAETPDLELFEQKIIKKLIEIQWPLVREYTVKKLFVPFVTFLVFYVVFMNYIYYLRQDSMVLLVLYYICIGPLAGLSLYFLVLEMKQLIQAGASYFTSVWNYLDITPPLMLLIFIPLALLGKFDRIYYTDANG